MDESVIKKSIVFTAGYEARADRLIQEHLRVARNQVEQLIEAGCAYVDGKKILKNGQKIKPNQQIELIIIEAPKKSELSCDISVDIIYEDEYLLIINKPPFLITHPAPSTKAPTLLDWLKQKGFKLSNLAGEDRCGIVHRLDKETSGVMIVAKDNKTHSLLSKALQEKSIGRYYLAIIDKPLKESIIVEKNLSRSPSNRLKIAVTNNSNARYAKSAFLKLLTSKDGSFELIAAKLFTGRTHQIRAHLAYLHRHILGDSLYGFKSLTLKIPRVFLHSYLLHLSHPITKKELKFIAPIPTDMKEFLDEHFLFDPIAQNETLNTLDSRFSVFN